jgi:hypothetical protein
LILPHFKHSSSPSPSKSPQTCSHCLCAKYISILPSPSKSIPSITPSPSSSTSIPVLGCGASVFVSVIGNTNGELNIISDIINIGNVNSIVNILGTATYVATNDTIIKDKVISLNLVSGGTGYTSSPTLTLTAAPVGITALATLTLAGNKITGITIGTAGSGYKTAPTITITSQTSTPTTAATFQPVLGGINYVKKFAWDIQPLSLDECGVIRVLKRTYSPFVVSSATHSACHSRIGWYVFLSRQVRGRARACIID